MTDAITLFALLGGNALIGTLCYWQGRIVGAKKGSK